MKKISVVLIFILAFLFAPAVHAEVQNTLSDEILVQAKAQADLFLELKNALGLDWLDKYNAYLQNPASKPVPTWDTSISSLINKGYLSAAFPTDFAVSISGNEAQISRNISSQAVRDAVKIYIPSATVSGNTVKLLVQRPAQWVAYESALNGKVSRDGSDSPDVLPGAQLDFGSGASINFISNNGKILGVNSLTYKGEELDTRFINASGDNMTGDLTIKGNKAWHAGNDGSGSGLDADLLDGKDSTYFTNASNLASGIVPVARLRGTYSIDISGNAATATNANYATSAGNADTVDGKHASDFALSGHTHGQYVQKTGDTMTGTLAFNKTLSSANKLLDLQQGYAVYSDNTGGSNGTRLWIDAPNGGEVIIGPRAGANFLNDIRLRSQVINLETNGNQDGVTINGNKVWHAGNDGSGSGLEADTLDGKHASELGGGLIPNGIKAYMKAGTYTWTKNPGTRFVFVKIWGGGGGTISHAGTGGTSRFGNYVYAYGGTSFNERAGTYGTYGKGGTASGGDINFSGEDGSGAGGGNSGNTPGSGGFHFFADSRMGYNHVVDLFATRQPTLGGGAGGHLITIKGVSKIPAGGGGGYAEKWIDVSSVSSETVVVGAGASSPPSYSPYPSYKGADGAVMIYEFK